MSINNNFFSQRLYRQLHNRNINFLKFIQELIVTVKLVTDFEIQEL